MPPHAPLRIGIVGGSARSLQLARAWRGPALALHGAEIAAVCDPEPSALAAAVEALELDLAEQGFAVLSQMLDSGQIDAVLIGTPMQFHAAQTIEALDRGVHVLCEVTAGVTIEECRAVVEAAARSTARYMMAENYFYEGTSRFIAGLVAQGRFGEPYYAECEYLIHMRSLSSQWRRHWMVGRKGVHYATHVMAPVLSWFNAASSDRIVAVSCADQGSRYADETGNPYASDGAVMMCKTARGRLIKVRCDLVSAQPGGRKMVLQGTRGCSSYNKTLAGSHCFRPRCRTPTPRLVSPAACPPGSPWATPLLQRRPTTCPRWTST